MRSSSLSVWQAPQESTPCVSTNCPTWRLWVSIPHLYPWTPRFLSPQTCQAFKSPGESVTCSGTCTSFLDISVQKVCSGARELYIEKPPGDIVMEVIDKLSFSTHSRTLKTNTDQPTSKITIFYCLVEHIPGSSNPFFIVNSMSKLWTISHGLWLLLKSKGFGIFHFSVKFLYL